MQSAKSRRLWCFLFRKLNGNFKFIDHFISDLKIPEDVSKCIVICPTSIHLDYIKKKNNNIYTGAQNVSQHNEGAYTGEISCASLYDLKVEFCIVGHSERRHEFNENNEDIKIKAGLLLDAKIIPIICIGETLEQKKMNKTHDVLKKQVINSLPQKSSKESVIIAYEPIWAIGTGMTASLEEINNIHEYLKKDIKEIEDYKILYGGSVNSKNASEIMNLENVDGVLVGGASLKADQFSEILKA